MKTINDMNISGDILAKDISARKQKMEHPVVEIIPLDVADVVIASPNNYEPTEKDNLG